MDKETLADQFTRVSQRPKARQLGAIPLVLLGQVCEAVRGNSLHLSNVKRDLFVDKYNRLKALLQEKDDIDLSDLCSFIRLNEGISVIPMKGGLVVNSDHEVGREPV